MAMKAKTGVSSNNTYKETLRARKLSVSVKERLHPRKLAAVPGKCTGL
jgi:hypothetical protein